jgi:2'-5' RNA ligase
VGETALLVPLPELASTVDRHRLHLTRAGRDGIPPHVTLLYPFTTGAELDPERLAQVGRLVAAVAPFEVAFARAERFDADPPILYLAPEPAAPFAALTAALVAAFPEHPPYDGELEALVPHLTVAIATPDVLDRVEAALVRVLPVRAAVTEAWLMERGADGRWARRHPLPLGG